MSTGSHPVDPPESAYDPELPFLAALEREVRRNALRAARRHEARARRGTPAGLEPAAARASSSHSAVARHLHNRPLRGASRVARRSLTLVALLCLIGASAYGAHAVFSGGTPNLAVIPQGPIALLAEGHAGSDSWSLRLYRREGKLCRVLTVAQSESSRCAPAPGAQSVASTSVVSPQRRYVFGVTGGDVAQVSVRTGGFAQVVPTHASDTAGVHAAGLPSGVRWFLVILSRPAGNSSPPAVVRGLDAKHHTLGSAGVSCVETAEQQQCR
jgi:hypothetical protein